MVSTGHSERDLHYHTQLQLPSDDVDWTSLTPTLTETESPEVGRVVDQLNEEHANSPPKTIDEVCNLVQDLRVCPPTTPVEELAANTPPTPTLFTETVAETVRPPLLLAQRATAIPARGVPNPPPLLQPSALGRTTM